MTKSSSNQKSLGQTLIYLLAWRLRLALIWLHGQTKSIIGDDEMETWSICFVAELVSTPCYISTILIPLKCLLFILIGTVANVPNIGQLLVRIYFTKSSAYLPSWKLLFIFLVSSRGCRDAEF